MEVGVTMEEQYAMWILVMKVSVALLLFHLNANVTAKRKEDGWVSWAKHPHGNSTYQTGPPAFAIVVFGGANQIM